MKIYGGKIEAFQAIQNYLGFNKIILTGSTALKILGFQEHSSPFDLDLVIHDIHDSTLKSLVDLHKITGGTELKYPDDDREVGGLVSLAFKLPEGELEVHIFLMKSKRETMNRPVLEMKDSDWGHIWINNPMNIIEAKQIMGRAKDYQGLAQIAANVIKSPYVKDNHKSKGRGRADAGQSTSQEQVDSENY